METNDIVMIAGIVVACIWLGTCILIEGKNRKYAVITGIVIDIVLFIICRHYEMLLCGVLGGLACGLLPTLVSKYKYERAVREFNGVKNWVGVSVVFFIMVFMIIALAYPGLEIVWEK